MQPLFTTLSVYTYEEYKRFNFAIMNFKQTLPILAVDIVLLAVSYTHLDVYKRQLSKLANLVAKDTEGCDLKGKACIISHVCCKEKAEHVKE